jgi:hypothetical protein
MISDGLAILLLSGLFTIVLEPSARDDKMNIIRVVKGSAL